MDHQHRFKSIRIQKGTWTYLVHASALMELHDGLLRISGVLDGLRPWIGTKGLAAYFFVTYKSSVLHFDTCSAYVCIS